MTELSPRSCSTQNRLVNRHQNRLGSARKYLSICRRVLSNLVLSTVHNFDFHLKSLLLTVNLFWSEIVFHNLSVVFKLMPDHAWSLIDCSSGIILKTVQKHTKLDYPKWNLQWCHSLVASMVHHTGPKRFHKCHNNKFLVRFYIFLSHGLPDSYYTKTDMTPVADMRTMTFAACDIFIIFYRCWIPKTREWFRILMKEPIFYPASSKFSNFNFQRFINLSSRTRSSIRRFRDRYLTNKIMIVGSN